MQYDILRSKLSIDPMTGTVPVPVADFKQIQTMRITATAGEVAADLSAAVGWHASLMVGTTIVCRTLDAGFDTSEAAKGIIVFTLNTNTEPYQQKVTAAGTIGELEVRGVNSSGVALVVFRFRMSCRPAIDADGQGVIPIPEEYAKKIWVSTNFIPNPDGGTPGQVLTKTAAGYAWTNATSSVFSVNGKTGAVIITAADILPSGQTANKYLGTDENNTLVWKTVEEPDYPVTSVNGKTGDAVLNADDVGAMSRAGWTVAAISGTAVPSAGKIYEHTLSAGEVFTFFTPEQGKDGYFELDLTQPQTAVSFTLPNVSWKFGVPDFSVGGKTYYLRFRYLNGAWQGWCTPEMSEYLKFSESVPSIKNGDSLSWTSAHSAHGNILNVHGDGLGFPYINVGDRYNAITTLSGRAILINVSINNRLDLNGHSLNTKGGLCASDATTGALTIPGVLTVNGAITSAGTPIIASTVAITTQDNRIYTHTLAASDNITFDCQALTSSHSIRFDLWISMPSDVVSFTWGGYTTDGTTYTPITWRDGDEYKSTAAEPSITDAGTMYCIQFIWTGSRLLGKLAYKEK